jgi:hypothetical protein
MTEHERHVSSIIFKIFNDDYMTDQQISELDEKIRGLKLSLSRLEIKRRKAIKQKFALAKHRRTKYGKFHTD